jgi:predicted transglutaminase-like cysteine proteinase
MSWIANFVAALALMTAAPSEPWGRWYPAIGPAPHAEHARDFEYNVTVDLILLQGCVVNTYCKERARRFLDVIAPATKARGRAQLGILNRAINAALRPTPDVVDEWYEPLETIASGKADCEDFAMVKYLALRFMGWSADDLALVIAYDPILKQYHAVTAARLDGTWLLLDCLTLSLVSPEASRYRPEILIRSGHVYLFARAA